MRGLDVTRSVHYPKAEDIPVAHAAIRQPLEAPTDAADLCS
jgi:hypothetical protein